MTRAQTPLSIVAMVAAGVASLRRYPGLAVSLYAVQLTAAVLASWVGARILAAAYATRPVFDRAVSGDLAALIFVSRDGRDTIAAVMAVGLGAAFAYVVVSWYLVGGLNAVLSTRPATRRDVAASFGTGGAATFFAYFRLALCSLIPHVIATAAVIAGFYFARDGMKYAVTGSELARALIPALLPGALLFGLDLTAVAYARIELSRKAVSGERPTAWRALLAGYRTVLCHRQPLLHTLLYVLFFAGVTALYVAFTQGQPMAGVAGAVAIFAIRQVVLGVRFAGKFACAGGQVAFAGARVEPHGASRG